MALVLNNVNDAISNWESYSTVKEWKLSLSQNSDDLVLARGTYNAMKCWFPRFLKSTIDEEHPNGLTPDELIDELLNADQIMIPKILKGRLIHAINFCKGIIKSQDENSLHNNVVTGIYGTIRGFYSHNLPFKVSIRTPKYKPRTVVTTDAITPLTEITINEDGKKIVDIQRDIFKRFLNELQLRDQVVVAGLLSSGMDSGDIVKVTIGMIREQSEHDRIFFSNFRNKTGEILNTFWSIEATALARKYLNTERRGAGDDECLLVCGKRQQKRDFFVLYHRAYNATKDQGLLPKLRPLTEKALARKLRKTAADIDIPLKKGVQSPLRPKKYRKLFSDACDKAGIGENKRKIFMGKSDKSDKVYAGVSRHELEIYYELVEQYVTIYRSDSKIEQENQSLRHQVIVNDETNTVRDDEMQIIKNQLKELCEKKKDKTKIKPDPETVRKVMKFMADNNML